MRDGSAGTGDRWLYGKRYGRDPGLWPPHLYLRIDTYVIQIGGQGLPLHLAGVLARGAVSEGDSPPLQPGAKEEGGNKLKKLAGCHFHRGISEDFRHQGHQNWHHPNKLKVSSWNSQPSHKQNKPGSIQHALERQIEPLDLLLEQRASQMWVHSCVDTKD